MTNFQLKKPEDNTLEDSSVREQATDPTGSYIVQAPAGSGKTEILTQRYLRLLSHVKAPEHIVALTFTRKAANEMRERILAALTRAANQIQPDSAHQERTQMYAKAALLQNKIMQWNLLAHPSRLTITTIDSLCQTLTKSIPLNEPLIQAASISEYPSILYDKAAKACLYQALQDPNAQKAMQSILIHLDNRQDRLFKVFRDLLSQRDQWLSIVYKAREYNKETFEEALASIEEHEIARFLQILPNDLTEPLRSLSQQVALIEGKPDSPRRSLCSWDDWAQFNGDHARALCALVLTSQQTLRKAFDHHVGLRLDACTKQEYTTLKSSSKELLAALNETPDLLEALIRIQNLPSPKYDAKQWDILQALFQLLPRLAAHLHLTFQEENAVDFTAISTAATNALGDEDMPTDLALYLDHQIQHLLVDEFQDTSLSQFQLLEHLVRGFEQNDGRTLFLVGDPMQSIYRFRAAEVGLFLRAKQQGIGNVKLTSLTLSCNFRSTKTLVDWVNTQFQNIFPRHDDITAGAIAYHYSIATKPVTNDPIQTIQALHYLTAQDEALGLIDTIKSVLDNSPTESLAILVRSRNQLKHIIPLLHHHKIPFQGVDIDLLAQLPHLSDIFALTEALLMPTNRLAWLTVLRSPWCGLSLVDLHCIANIDRKKSIYESLAQTESLLNLSIEGRLRATFFYNVMHQAIENRAEQNLVEWITATANQLHIKSILTIDEQQDLEHYWQLLDHFQTAGLLHDWEAFKTEFNRLYSKKVTPSALQIMTIHKSKGLEFDHVFLPGLSSISPNKHQPLLRWLQLPMEHNSLLLFSPLKAADADKQDLYDYLSKIEAEKQEYERQRLFYVAITRAKKRIYLFDYGATRKRSFRSLLNHPFQDTILNPSKPTAFKNKLTLKHLPNSYYTLAHNNSLTTVQPLSLAMSSPLARLIGIVTHELLQWICTKHPQTFNDVPWSLAINSLSKLGIYGNLLKDALITIQTYIQALFINEYGNWIIRSHSEEINEYAVNIEHQGNVVTYILDRTFIENNIRWIIDFKTGSDDPANHHAHKQQLATYSHILTARFAEPIRCGIYYLSTAHWVEI